MISRWPAAPLTRFAPAPTGHLHLGHVVNAIHVWGLAGALGGRVLLRIEDHDRQRCRPEYEASILDDLDWLGLEPDVFPTAAFRAGRCEGRQSNRDAVYRRAIDTLAGLGLVYGCRCTRREIEATDDGAAGELRYPGTCRPLGLPLVDGLSWRLAVEPGGGGVRRRPPRADGSGSGRAVRRPPAARSARQLDLSVRRQRGRHGPGRRPGRARRRSVRVDRPADPAGAPARTRDAAGVRAPPPDHEVADTEAQQERRRHGRARPARRRLDAGSGAGRRRPRRGAHRACPRGVGADLSAIVGRDVSDSPRHCETITGLSRRRPARRGARPCGVTAASASGHRAREAAARRAHRARTADDDVQDRQVTSRSTAPTDALSRSVARARRLAHLKANNTLVASRCLRRAPGDSRQCYRATVGMLSGVPGGGADGALDGNARSRPRERRQPMQDLTTGPIIRHLVSTGGFMLFTMVFQTLYFLADLYWMGRLGKEAVAGGGRRRQPDVRRAGPHPDARRRHDDAGRARRRPQGPRRRPARLQPGAGAVDARRRRCSWWSVWR